MSDDQLKIENAMLRQALMEIARQDYRGNMPVEVSIARQALKKIKAGDLVTEHLRLEKRCNRYLQALEEIAADYDDDFVYGIAVRALKEGE
jgi:hypothetical protein